MNGIKREYGYPILYNENETAVKDEENANVLQKVSLNPMFRQC